MFTRSKYVTFYVQLYVHYTSSIQWISVYGHTMEKAKNKNSYC